MQLRSEKMAAVLSRMTADENALRAAQFKEEDMKDQAETTLEVLATALLNLVHHGAFAQKDAADGKPNVTDTLEKVAEDELEETAETTTVRRCRLLTPTSRSGRSDGEGCCPVLSPNRHHWRLASNG